MHILDKRNDIFLSENGHCIGLEMSASASRISEHFWHLRCEAWQCPSLCRWSRWSQQCRGWLLRAGNGMNWKWQKSKHNGHNGHNGHKLAKHWLNIGWIWLSLEHGAMQDGTTICSRTERSLAKSFCVGTVGAHTMTSQVQSALWNFAKKLLWPANKSRWAAVLNGCTFWPCAKHAKCTERAACSLPKGND